MILYIKRNILVLVIDEGETVIIYEIGITKEKIIITIFNNI